MPKLNTTKEYYASQIKIKMCDRKYVTENTCILKNVCLLAGWSEIPTWATNPHACVIRELDPSRHAYLQEHLQ